MGQSYRTTDRFGGYAQNAPANVRTIYIPRGSIVETYEFWLRLVTSECSRQTRLSTTSRSFLAVSGESFWTLAFCLYEVMISLFNLTSYVGHIKQTEYMDEYEVIQMLEFQGLYMLGHIFY